MELNKEYFEKLIGKEIISYDIEPIYDDNGNLELFIRVVPKQTLSNIEIPINILRTGDVIIDTVDVTTKTLQDELKKSTENNNEI